MATNSLRTRLRLGWGKGRRFYLVHFNKDYVRRSVRRRHGRCKRCGSCCRLMLECPYLRNGGEEYECIVHDRRRKNCQVFPIDERDIADRDRVSRDGPCGYTFSPTDGRARWFTLSLLVSCGLALLASQGPAEAQSTVYEARFRGLRPPAASHPPVESSPTPGWYAAGGKWRLERGGFVVDGSGAEAAGEIRCDSVDFAGRDFRAEVLADVSGAPGKDGVERLVALEVGWLTAGLSSPSPTGPMCAFIELGGEAAREELDRPPVRGRFQLLVETDGGLVSLSVGGGRPIRKRDVFHRWRPQKDGGARIRASAGAVVYEARVRTFAARERPEVLASADRAMGRGDGKDEAGRLRAAALYSQAVADEALLPSQHAEAAYKLGLLIEAAEPIDAARAFDRAKRLDPEGPWGERSRLELARAAVVSGREDLALAFAHRLVVNASSGLEEWEAFQDLVSTARERLVSAKRGARATYHLRLIAQYLEWADAPPKQVLWAWNEAALSYAGRGWHAEADAVRDRAVRLLGPRSLARASVEEAPKGAPSSLPEPALRR